ncbi:MAG: hypothetical protein EOM40_14725 [Clostridia bacterium]|nr:hypothetical protein [Clostridia bacterium]
MSKNLGNPLITFCGKRNGVYIGIDVIRLLGMPEYVCLYKTENYGSVAVGACSAKNVMSFKVPDKLLDDQKCDCVIHSKNFLDALMTANGWEREKNYRIRGEYLKEKNLVTFKLNDATMSAAG